MIIDKIEKYINDPENAKYNYELGFEYEKLHQYSAATTYYLRAADRTGDNELVYRSLISAAHTLIEHGNNTRIVENMLSRAIEMDSSRPEPYYLLCLNYKYNGNEEEFNKVHENFLNSKQKSEIFDMIDLSTVLSKNEDSFDTIRHSADQPLKDFKQKIQKEYTTAATTPSDINEHLPVLFELAKKCDHITEMGVRTGVSTRSFLMSKAKIISYDIESNQGVVSLIEEATLAGKDATFIEADVLKIDIEETDLLFIDTWHTYDQLKQELSIHANKAKKYIVFHDTNTYGLKNEGGEITGTSQGLLPAIIEFLIDNPHWRFKKFLTNNNGLTILERVAL